MATVSRRLPEQPHIDIPKREARELLTLWRNADPAALERIEHRHPKFRGAPPRAIASATFRLSDAQLVLAREYVFCTWSDLKHRIGANSAARELLHATRAN